MKPFFTVPGLSTYLGGKNAAGVLHQIINQIPRHETFVSGFLGHCAVMRFKLPAQRSIGVEINHELATAWKKAITDPTQLLIHHDDFLNRWINTPTGPDTFLYLDPPYPISTRKSHHRYPNELTDEQHEELLRIASNLFCKTAISTYDNPLYKSCLAGWRKIQFPAKTRGNTIATETLYMNYPQPRPADLHDTRFIGQDYRTREKSKRRVLTIARKIQRLEPQEAARLVGIIQNQFPSLFTK